MNKSKDILTIDSLMILCEFLEEGYSLLECLDLVIEYEPKEPYSKLKSYLLSGEELSDALLHFEIERDWLEFFIFISKLASYSHAMRGAYRLVSIKKEISKILSKQLTYPFALVVCMLFFSIFMIRVIRPQLVLLLSSFDLQQSPVEIVFIQMVTYVPWLVFSLIMIAIVFCFDLYRQIRNCNFQKLKQKLNQPISMTILQFYYSIKFACYYAILSEYVNGLYDGILLMYEKMAHSDLMVVIYDFKLGLENGKTFETIMMETPFFHPSFKKFCSLLIKQGKSFCLLDDYVKRSVSLLEKKMKRYSQLLMMMIYAMTGLFVVILYLLLMMPMMQIASQL